MSETDVAEARFEPPPSDEQRAVLGRHPRAALRAAVVHRLRRADLVPAGGRARLRPTGPSSGARPAATGPSTPPPSTTRPGPGRDPADGPYVVALVELAEGVRMMTNVVGCPPDDVTVGMPVRLAWQPLSDGRNLPQFAPA